jgi:cytochrome b pre-mRNA-processing protein 3
MSLKFLNIYNNLIQLTTNKKLYQGLTNQDTFEDRLVLFLIHFAFFLNVYNKKEDKNILQDIYDLNFRQLELSIREIGYGDQSINKKMKDYVNLFHQILSDLHLWNELNKTKKEKILSNFLRNFSNIQYLTVYFDDFKDHLSEKTLNSYIKSVNNQ